MVPPRAHAHACTRARAQHRLRFDLQTNGGFASSISYTVEPPLPNERRARLHLPAHHYPHLFWSGRTWSKNAICHAVHAIRCCDSGSRTHVSKDVGNGQSIYRKALRATRAWRAAREKKPALRLPIAA